MSEKPEQIDPVFMSDLLRYDLEKYSQQKPDINLNRSELIYLQELSKCTDEFISEILTGLEIEIATDKLTRMIVEVTKQPPKNDSDWQRFNQLWEYISQIGGGKEALPLNHHLLKQIWS